ncbi:MAG: class I SAM-dependent DNA methyltransferase, partial [Synergistaceae bacterium]|nr:class I SAM-dependent DNA methyltransferase [Synergistaceae bacterium]
RRFFGKFLFMADLNASSPKDIHEEEISVKAGELARKLRDSLEKRYKNPKSREAQQSLTVICVRIVFLLYAEDTELSGGGRKFQKGSFHDYMLKHKDSSRRALIDLFAVLSQKVEERDPYLDSDLADFPYVNGGLFDETNIEIPQIDGEPLEIILREMSEGFDWSGINSTIFGAIFESVLDGGSENEKSVRREGGMHYTSIENIHKVIDPLFLENLKADLDKILKSKSTKRTKNLIEFQESLGKLKFLDPACGSGNFLTETYLSLRRIENQILSELTKQQINFATGDLSPIKIKISQFFGIEINGFAVAVAKTALWIAEAQMWNETKNIIQNLDDFLPLENYGNILEANALKIDWAALVKPEDLNFIMGNPPFIGRRYRSEEQHEEVRQFFDYKDIDYVACWYMIAADYIQGTNIECAFVSTNSVTQGEQVAPLWKPLLKDKKIFINFAYRTFRWLSEAKDKAAVHCVIIGFSCVERSKKIIFDSENRSHYVKHINGYLTDAPDVFIGIRSRPLCDVPVMKNGNVPLDGDALKIEAGDLPLFGNFPYIKQLMGGRELLHNEKRYVLWLVGVSPGEIHKNSKVVERVKLCRENRLNMKDKGTQKLAETPTTFRDTNNPEKYIALPMVSSENRKYIPMAYLNSDVIPTNQIQTIPDATLYHFGVLTSFVHMAWVRVVAGRLKSDFRYSKDIVYNNFPWPLPSEKQKLKIEMTAKKILEAREKFPESSLADLYDPLTMPGELLKAHKANDIAVCEAYGFDKNISEEEIVSALMRLYEKISKEE